MSLLVLGGIVSLNRDGGGVDQSRVLPAVGVTQMAQTALSSRFANQRPLAPLRRVISS